MFQIRFMLIYAALLIAAVVMPVTPGVGAPPAVARNAVEVVPLGLHVDYWNFQGWTDRFSSDAYTRRQQKYAERFRIEGPYTPQMVVDGQLQFTGNDALRARQAILQAAQRPQPAQIQITPGTPDVLQVQVK